MRQIHYLIINSTHLLKGRNVGKFCNNPEILRHFILDTMPSSHCDKQPVYTYNSKQYRPGELIFTGLTQIMVINTMICVSPDLVETCCWNVPTKFIDVLKMRPFLEMI